MSIILKDQNTSDHIKITRNAGVVSGATLLSRLLGAVRDIAIASFFGAGMVSDAFVAAFRIPNLLRRMFGEGSLSIAFVPVFTECLVQQGRYEAQQLAASAIRLLALVLVVCVGGCVAFAPWLVHIVAPGFVDVAQKYALTVDLSQIMFPYIFFVGLVALSMGILNVLGHFAAPALAPVCLNVGMIVALFAGNYFVETKSQLAFWLAGGVLAGGGLQLGLQVPFLITYKIHFWRSLRLWHPAIKKVLLMMGPVLFGATVYQINNVIGTLLASMLPQGSVSYLYYADRIVQFPLGLFGIATATAVFPTMARQSSQGQYEALRDTFAYAVKLVLFVTLPAMAGLIVLREPIVALLFQRGAFDQVTVRLTASALLYYGIGLWAFSIIRVVLNTFYALKDTRTPVRMAVISIIVNLFLGILLMGSMRHNGLALALSMASMVNLGLLTIALRRRLGALGWHTIVAMAVKSGVCATMMGLGVWGASQLVLADNSAKGAALLPGLMVCILTGIMIYGLLSYIMRISELEILINMVRNRSD